MFVIDVAVSIGRAQVDAIHEGRAIEFGVDLRCLGTAGERVASIIIGQILGRDAGIVVAAPAGRRVGPAVSEIGHLPVASYLGLDPVVGGIVQVGAENELDATREHPDRLVVPERGIIRGRSSDLLYAGDASTERVWLDQAWFPIG